MRIINPAALDEFRGPGRCCICKCSVANREPFHCLAAGRSNGSRIDHPFNLLAVCKAFSGGFDCHAKWHMATLTIDGRRATLSDMFEIVAEREGLPRVDMEDAVRYFSNINPKLNDTEIQHRMRTMRAGTAKLVRVLLEART